MFFSLLARSTAFSCRPGSEVVLFKASGLLGLFGLHGVWGCSTWGGSGFWGWEVMVLVLETAGAMSD